MPTDRTLIVAFALAAVLALPPQADARHDDALDRDLLEVANRIEGGAALLDEIASSREVDDFHDRARRFQRALDDDSRGRRILEDWRELREQFRRLEGLRGARNARVDFLFTHLAEDVAAGDRIVGRGGFGGPDAGSTPGRVSFVRGEACVGVKRVGPKPCPSPRGDLTFRIPREVSVIRKISGEWRDFGRGAVAQIYVDDRFVWGSDVAKDWDSDARSDLGLRVAPGSTITVVSQQGDPLWVRRLDIEYEGDDDRSHRGRDDWGRY